MKRDFCCYGDCHQSRRCPHRPAQPPTRREWLFTVGFFIVMLVLSFALSACGPTTSAPAEGEKAIAALDPWLYKDRATGCEYLSTRPEHGLAPRIAADGKTHMGCREVQK